jgi:class 3 adenylate cyclase
MAEREYVATETRTIAAHPALVWALVADTNRFDRAVGLTPGQYEFQDEDVASTGTGRVPIAHAKQMGFEIAWIEPPYEWVEGRSVRGFRQFVKGPASAGGFEVKLEPDGDGTKIVVRIYTRGDTVALRLAGPIVRRQIQRGIRRYLDAIVALLEGHKLTFDQGHEPPASVARRALMVHRVDEVATGVHTPNIPVEFDRRARRLKDSPIDATILGRLFEFLRTQSDDEVRAMRPFEIAAAWGADRREVLRVFLYAARAGLVDLNWQINCPTCRVGAGFEPTLDKVSAAGHCAACNISYDVDFAMHVEAIFRINDAIRHTEPMLYCASSPWFRPHVFAQLGVEPKGTEKFDGHLPWGPLLFRTLVGKRTTMLSEGKEEAAPPARVTVVVTDDAVTVKGDGEAAIGEASQVSIENRTAERAVVLIERAGWNAEIVRGSVITTLADFIDLFATEAPATGRELTVGTLTLLFTDLTGSTAMYERIGDARAFAIVSEHFRLLAEAAAQHQGAIVKTMGDAIMASFSSPANAMRAAIQMVEKTHEAHGDVGLTVKIGLHEGPCLAVRANDRLDFFGTTVNVAARLQAQAHPSEIVVMKELLAHPDIAEVVGARAFPQRAFEAQLKGIREVQKLIAIDATPAASRESQSAPVVATKIEGSGEARAPVAK